MLTEVQIGCLLIDTNTDQPVIMLQDVSGRRAIPIVIGLAEAGAIASELENIEFPRPMTHDLMRSLVESLDATVKHVVINDLRDNTFFARVVLIHGGKRLKVDARPSDAIALAVRCSAPIFAAEHVLKQAAVQTEEEETDERLPEGLASTSIEVPRTDDPDAVRDFLEKLSPEDFGKYKM